jgi:formylglycine-generating enzyme required for sulfatase activity
MSDIFISYANEDRNRVLPIVDALKKMGWSVFWDKDITAGRTWRRIIGSEVQRCRAVVVVWSVNSVSSDMVQEEADVGKKRKILVPVLFDNVVPPFGFGGVQAVDLLAWRGDSSAPAFLRLIADIDAVLNRAHRNPERRRSEQTMHRVLEWARARVEHGSEENPKRVNSRPDENKERWLKSLALSSPWLKGAVALAFVILTIISVLSLWPKVPMKTSIQEPFTSIKQPVTPIKEPVTSMPSKTVVVKSPTVLKERLNSYGPGMVEVPAGSFQMGDIQGGADSSEQPVHTVTIHKPFGIGRYEVTFEEYDQFARATGRKLPNDQGWGRGRRPVINVSWNDSRDYTVWLSEQTGKRYRLPSEAEWEYAARNGGKDESSAGTSHQQDAGEYAWYIKNSKKQSREVGTRKPNSLGIYDMSGNVWEWVDDCWHENYQNAPSDGRAWGKEDGGRCDLRMARGGSWNDEPKDLRVSTRFWSRSDSGVRTFGFRLVQDVQ